MNIKWKLLNFGCINLNFKLTFWVSNENNWISDIYFEILDAILKFLSNIIDFNGTFGMSNGIL